LVGRATNPSGFYFDRGRNRFKRRVKNLNRVFAAAALDTIQCAVYDFLSDRLLTAVHNMIHELGKGLVMKFWIRDNDPFFGDSSSWHDTLSSGFIEIKKTRPYSRK